MGGVPAEQTRVYVDPAGDGLNPKRAQLEAEAFRAYQRGWRRRNGGAS
jgi:hypothetical protein